MKHRHMIGLLLVAALFVGATFHRESMSPRYEYATLELGTAVQQHEVSTHFDYTMAWRDSLQTVEASASSRDWTMVPISFFRKLNLPTFSSDQTQKLERFLSALGSQGWQIHTVQYGTDGQRRITSYLMMRQMQ